MKFFRDISEIDATQYIIATYLLAGENVRDVAWALAAGQSTSNPTCPSKWETEEMLQSHSAIVLADENHLRSQKSELVKIAFPVANINWESDGLSHLLTILMGGQMDIDLVEKCQLVNLEIPDSISKLTPKYGILGMRKFTGIYNKPLLGGIIKPKIGATPQVLLDMVKEMVEGGVNFIKEDEIMADPNCARMTDRLPLIYNYLADKKVIYCATINGDPIQAVEKAKLVHKLGGNGIHINVWAGMGTYRNIRQLDLPLFFHYQKSGDKTFTDTSHRFHISFLVLCQLMAYQGVDCAHCGMMGGGYSTTNNKYMENILHTLRTNNIMPALSCGLNAVNVQNVIKEAGTDFLANSGGGIHGHPLGSKAGAMSIRQAIDGTYGPEYDVAIQKWGLMK